MNYVQLVGRLRRKCRVSGSNPTTLAGNKVEEINRLMDWINEAWMAIQSIRPDWDWMRKSTSFPTSTLVPTYQIADITALTAAFTDFGNWAPNTFRNYVTAVGLASEFPMEHIDYDVWRNRYQLGAPRFTATRPIEVSIGPGQSLNLGPTPIDGYTISGDYYAIPGELSADTDTPTLPVQFHMAIVYRAMMYYGMSEAAPEVYQEGQAEYAKMLRSISNQQSNHFSLPGSLA